MKKELFITLLALLFAGPAFAQIGSRTGKDSISIETSMVVMTEKFTTAEIYAFTRNTANKPAYVFNSDTETLWAWTGTEWKDLGLAPLNGSITIDPTITNGSTNPVENNAIWDRFVEAVDDDPFSQFQDVTIYRGDSAHFAANKASLGARYIAFVTDYEYDPSPTGIGQDAKISNVTVIDNTMTFTGENGAFNGTVSLPSGGGGGTDDQILDQLNFNNTTNFLTIGIENGNVLSTSLSKLYQPASAVEFEDANVPMTAADVQEAIDKMFSSGAGTASGLIAAEYTNSITDVEDIQYEFARVGNIVYFNAQVVLNISVNSPGTEYDLGGRILFQIPRADGLPLTTTTLAQPTSRLLAGRTNQTLTPGLNERAWCHIRNSFDNSTVDLYLNYAARIPQGIDVTGAYTITISGTYQTNEFD